jgi:hypothetical protein
MTDDDVKDMVQHHDKSISLMTQSLEHLASEVGTSNRKLEDIISVIGRQNVLMEKFSNLESNLKESFSRLHEKDEKLERDKANKAELKTIIRDIASLQDSQKWIVRVIIGSFITGLIATLFILVRN